MVRLIAQMSLGTGALAVIGGTVVIVGFLTMSTGSLVAHPGLQLSWPTSVCEALTGFASAYFNVRLSSPLIAGIGLAATIGAGATAQLGAMRINEEIDALEVMGIRIDRLPGVHPGGGRRGRGDPAVLRGGVDGVSGRPRSAPPFIYGQSTGVYDHYFNTFLNPTDLIWSFLQAVSMADRGHAGAYLLRLHRLGRAGRRRGGGRSRGAHLADRRRCS